MRYTNIPFFAVLSLQVFLFGVQAQTASLPACPDSGIKHNCSGKEDYPGGATYTGEFKDGQRHGQGVYKTANGSLLTGTFVANLPSGKIAYVYSSGDTYVGDIKNGVLQGQGTLSFISGDQYVGDFLSDLRTGKGTYVFKNGDKLWVTSLMANSMARALFIF
ncbi:MAG: hypothetical protein EBQ84_01060 [Betaproteobacteria bacterium]|nr:hypothetical protein [Betaproteobacteria bacterium]